MAELIVALDFPSLSRAAEMVDTLRKEVSFFKVGLELFTRCGPDAVKMVRDRGCDVFLDLKIHDIPNTAAGAVRSAANLGCRSLTIHAASGREALKAAAGARESGAPLLWGVTLLSSIDGGDGSELAALAFEAGLDGVIASGEGVVSVKKSFPRLQIITPGIRPRGGDADDQKRVLTPAQAVRAGADFLVVGRPVTRAGDPAAAAALIKEEASRI